MFVARGTCTLSVPIELLAWWGGSAAVQLWWWGFVQSLHPYFATTRPTSSVWIPNIPNTSVHIHEPTSQQISHPHPYTSDDSASYPKISKHWIQGVKRVAVVELGPADIIGPGLQRGLHG